MPKISVIVPIYNIEKYLSNCIESLLNQTYQDLEIILINDGSTDDSSKIIEKYAKKYSNIKAITKENGGQASARNLGISVATGEYISFVDGDDYVDKNLYQSLSFFISNKYDIIIFDYYNDYGTHKLPIQTISCVDNKNVTEKEYLLSSVSPCNKLYKTSFLQKNKFTFPEGIIYEDYASIPTLVKYHPQVGYVDKYLYYYVQSDSSTMRTQEYKQKYENLFPATEYLYQNLHGLEYEEELEFIITKHTLYHGALNFYKYKKYDQIDKISYNIKNKFPKWLHNKYMKKESLKVKVLCYLFYRKQYKLIAYIQKIKKGGVS